MARERAQAVSEPPVSWIITNWRLKLLSLILAVGLVGGVAFSENPPVFDTVPVLVQFANPPAELVVMNPPTKIEVPVAGLRDAVTRYKNTAAGVTIDLANAKPGPNQVFAVTPKIDVPGVTVRSRVDPIRLTLERQETRQLDIEIRTPKASSGIAVIPEKTYATCGSSNDRCQVSVTAASSIANILKAYVDYDVTLTTANTVISPNELIKFEENGHSVDLQKDVKSFPAATFTPSNVTVQVATRGGTMTRAVGVGIRTTGTLACGYAITRSDVQPSLFVTVTGPVDQLTRLATLTIDPIDISGLTGTTIVDRRLQTSSPQVVADPPLVRVTLAISQAFNCVAPSTAVVSSPGPTASPSR